MFLVAVGGQRRRDHPRLPARPRRRLALFSDDATRINNLVYLYPLAGIVWAFALVPCVARPARRVAPRTSWPGSARRRSSSPPGAAAGWSRCSRPFARAGPRAREIGVGGSCAVLVGVAVVVVLVIARRQLAFHEADQHRRSTSAKDRLFSLGERDDDVSTSHRLAEFRRGAQADLPTIRSPASASGRSITFVSPLYNATAESCRRPDDEHLRARQLPVGRAQDRACLAFVGLPAAARRSP